MPINLTEQEKHLVAALRRRRDQWPALKRAMIVLTAANLFFALLEFLGNGWSAMPFIFLLVAAGSAATIYRDWHGPATITLLLRLLEKEGVGEA